MWLSEQLPMFDQINALKFDIKLLCSDGGIIETLNKYNGSYHKNAKINMDNVNQKGKIRTSLNGYIVYAVIG